MNQGSRLPLFVLHLYLPWHKQQRRRQNVSGFWWNSWARSFSHSWQSPWGGKESAALKRWSCLLWGRWVSDKLFKLQTHQCNYIFTQKLMNEWMNRATCDYRTRLLGVLLHQKQLCHCIVWNVCCVTVDS